MYSTKISSKQQSNHFTKCSMLNYLLKPVPVWTPETLNSSKNNNNYFGLSVIVSLAHNFLMTYKPKT